MEALVYLFYWLYAALLVGAAIIDIRSHRIEPRLVCAMFGVAAIKTALEVVSNEMYLTSLWAALISGAVTTLVFWGMYRFSHGIGLGDVKLMAAAGLFYSVRGIFTIVIFSMLLVAAAGVIMIIKSRSNLKAELPFAPFVAAAAIIREIMILTDKL